MQRVKRNCNKNLWYFFHFNTSLYTDGLLKNIKYVRCLLSTVTLLRIQVFGLVHCVAGLTVPYVSKKCHAFETMGYVKIATQRNIPEDQNHQVGSNNYNLLL
jgi:hypothetical protein